MNASILLLIIGLFIILCSFMKPAFFWEHKSAVNMRKVLGDRNTAGLYVAIGIIAIGVGIYGFVGGPVDMSIFRRHS